MASLKANLKGSKTSLNEQTQKGFLTLTLITQACHGVLNTTFVPPDPKPTWYDDLLKKLDAAKVVAAEWINDRAPEVTSSVPLAVINYGTTFAALSNQIRSIANAHPDAQGKNDPYVIQVNALIGALIGQVQTIISSVDTAGSNLKAWGVKVQTAHDDLAKGAVNIQSAEVALQGDIDKMNNAIKTLNETIHQENMAIAGSVIGIAVGLLLLVVGIALAPETGGASLLVAGTGGLLIVGGGVTWGIMQHKIDQQFDQIAKDQNEIAADKRQIVALQGLSSAANQAIQYLAEAGNALSDFRTSWGVFEGELKAVVSKLQAGEASLQTIVAEGFTNAAQNEWNDATVFAQNLAGMSVQFPKKVLPMSSNLAA